MKERNYFERNMAALAERDPALADKITRHKFDLAKYKLVNSDKDSKINLMIPERKMFFYDPRNVTLSVRNDVDSANLKNPKLTIFLGFGLGYHLSEFRKYKESNLVKRIIIIEKDLAILKLAFSLTDYSSFLKSPEIKLIGGVDIGNVYNEFYNHFLISSSKLFAKAMTIVSCGGSISMDKDYYLQTVKYIRHAMHQTVSDFGNSPEDSLQGLENTLRNIEYILSYPGIVDFTGAFKNKPAVLVSSGPSLDKNIELLRELGDKALIIACDASYKSLLKKGIQPHMVTSIERVIENLNFYDNLGNHEEMVKKTYFAGTPIQPKEIYDICVRDNGMRCFNVYRKYPYNDWIGIEKGGVACGKSVANLAFNILSYLECSPIVLIGQDLAFGSDGRSHEEGANVATNDLKKWLDNPKLRVTNYGMEEMWVEGNYVPKIKTIKWWYLFKRSFEKDIAGYGGRVINATEGGAKIEGAELMTFREAIDKHIPAGDVPFEILDKYYNAFEKGKIHKDIENLTNVMENTKVFCKDMMEKCDEGMEVIEQFRVDLEEKTEGKAVPFKDLDITWVRGVVENIEKLKVHILDDETFNLFMINTVQMYIINVEIEIASLDGKFDHKIEVFAAYIKMMSSWFPTMKRLIKVSEDYLDKGYEDLKTFRKKLENSEEIKEWSESAEVNVG